MKVRGLLGLLSIILVPATIFGAAQKIGVIDVDKVYNEFVDTGLAEQQFTQESEQWEKELNEKEEEIIRLQTEYDNLPPIVSKERRQQKLQEIQQKKEEYNTLANEYRNKAVDRQLELLAPISERIVEVINEVAEEYGLDIVINTMQGEIVLYIKDEDIDITTEVLDRLNAGSGTVPQNPEE
ncbi:MAG TPA: OmpH family outer membrane protein [Candidatus Cloacimonetes bacterium]|nr:OmpH family outer membrane protein [Candidatus Cloacimonadota bacterium]HEX37738.1 OmpH family outer membrane protein [Candidatus Cloacimonadota bacterium]